MPKSKQRKNHKQKVDARTQKVAESKKKYEKMQKEMLMSLIEQEKQRGLFNNIPQISSENSIDSQIQGPII